MMVFKISYLMRTSITTIDAPLCSITFCVWLTTADPFQKTARVPRFCGPIVHQEDWRMSRSCAPMKCKPRDMSRTARAVKDGRELEDCSYCACSVLSFPPPSNPRPSCRLRSRLSGRSPAPPRRRPAMPRQCRATGECGLGEMSTVQGRKRNCGRLRKTVRVRESESESEIERRMDR